MGRQVATEHAPLLVITATAAEAAPLCTELASLPGFMAATPGVAAEPATEALSGSLGSAGIVVRVLGVGKTNTSYGLTRALHDLAPRAVVQLGIGGTYAGSFVPVGGAAVAEDEYELDYGVLDRAGWRGTEALGFPLIAHSNKSTGNRIRTDPELTRWLSLEGRVPMVSFGTSDAVSGDLDVAAARRERADLAVESMEGAAGAQVALLAGVPFAEIRGISNVAGQRDKSSWEIRAALRAATTVLVRALRSGPP